MRKMDECNTQLMEARCIHKTADRLSSLRRFNALEGEYCDRAHSLAIVSSAGRVLLMGRLYTPAEEQRPPSRNYNLGVVGIILKGWHQVKA